MHEALHHDPAKKIASVLKNAKSKRKHKKETTTHEIQEISVQGAEQNNLKHLDVKIPRLKMTVCTGPSGSGKSSLAFDTIYAEGQRRYIESLSPYARQFVKQMPKPKVGHVEGLSPAIAIEQKAHAGNPRSTVGTMTEIYDYLRILYARLGIPHCPETGEVIKAISKEHVVNRISSYPEGEKIQVLAPIEMRKNEKFDDAISRLQRLGFLRIRLNGEYFDLDTPNLGAQFDRKRKNELFLVVDRLKIAASGRHRLFEAVENAARLGEGKLVIAKESGDVAFNLAFAVESTGKSYPEITPHTFAFNNAAGMCLDCQGLGYQYGANLMQKAEIMSQYAAALIRFLWREKYSAAAFRLFEAFLNAEGIPPYTPLNELSADHLQLIMHGSPAEKWVQGPGGYKFRWVGINHVLAKIAKGAKAEIRQPIIPMLDELECLSCQGTRLNPLARHVTIDDVSIGACAACPSKKPLPSSIS